MTDFDMTSFWGAEFDEHVNVMARTRDRLMGPFGQMIDICENAIRAGNKIMFFGNGGSAADAQHLSTELTVRFIKDRQAIAAIALTTDTSALTAIGNDLGFDQLFSRQVDALGNAGDVAIGITTSGNSSNVINAFTMARKKGIVTIGMTGETGGKLVDYADILINVPSRTTARIQEMHILIGHMLCGALEQRLDLVQAA